MAEDEEALRRALVELRILEGTARELSVRLEIVNSALNEMHIASSTIDGLSGKENVSIFVPIGGGSYLKAKAENVERVVVGIGANVAVERTTEEAKEKIQEQIAELSKSMSTLQQQIAQVAQEIEGRRRSLNELAKKMSERTKGV